MAQASRLTRSGVPWRRLLSHTRARRPTSSARAAVHAVLAGRARAVRALDAQLDTLIIEVERRAACLPLPTSYGEDLYARIFGADCLAAQAHPGTSV